MTIDILYISKTKDNIIKALFTDVQLKNAKSKTLLPIECKMCDEIFYKSKHYIKSHIFNPNQHSTGDFCSNKCSSSYKKNKIITKICSRCGNEFDTVSGHSGNKYCSNFCAHSRKQTDKTKAKISTSLKISEKAKISNKKRQCELIKKVCPICEKYFKVYPSEKYKIYCSKKCYNNDKKCEFRKKSSGGLREGSGRSKSGWYSGYYCNSSYELAWVIYHIEHNIKFKRNTDGFDYFIDNEKHKYYPDFIIGDNYYEIKGFLRKNDKYKFEYFKHNLIIQFKEDLKDIFDYVIDKHGKNFIELYEGNPHKQKNNICLICSKPAKNLYCSRKCSGIAVCRHK